MIRGGKSIHKHHDLGGRGCCQLHALLPAAVIHTFTAIEAHDEPANRQLGRHGTNIHQRQHEQPVLH